MSLSASALGGLIDAALAGDGAKGPKRSTYALALATGIVQSIGGKSFQTADVGSTVGSPGAGTGVGITGLNSASMASTAAGALTRKGPKADSMMAAIMQAVVAHLSSAATLVSVHPSVGLGVGHIVVGSIAVVTSEMAGNIQSALAGDGASGPQLGNIALAVATGVCTGIQQSGTGTVAIAGAPGVPSAGTGTGTVS